MKSWRNGLGQWITQFQLTDNEWNEEEDDDDGRENKSDAHGWKWEGRRIERRVRGRGRISKNIGMCYIINSSCILLKQNAIYGTTFPFLMF